MYMVRLWGAPMVDLGIMHSMSHTKRMASEIRRTIPGGRTAAFRAHDSRSCDASSCLSWREGGRRDVEW